MAELGDSLMLPKPGHTTEHLWVLITRPHPETFETIMVNVTTQRPHSDTTTILNAGDHPFVQKPSVIFYADARIADTRLLDKALQHVGCHRHAVFEATVMARNPGRCRGVAVYAEEDQNRLRGLCCRRSDVITG